jgi:hypothetical protein
LPPLPELLVLWGSYHCSSHVMFLLSCLNQSSRLGIFLEKCGSTIFLPVLETTMVLIIWSLAKRQCSLATTTRTEAITWDESHSLKCKSCLGNKVASWHRLEAFWSSSQLPASSTTAVNLSLLVCQKSTITMKLNGQAECHFRKIRSGFEGREETSSRCWRHCLVTLFILFLTLGKRLPQNVAGYPCTMHPVAHRAGPFFVFPVMLPE